MITRLKSLHRALIGGVAALLVAGSALAAASADEVIKTSTTKIRSDISQNAQKYQADKNAFYSMVDREIVPHFDTQYIAKVILGAHLKQASAEQVAQFETAFKNMLVRGYADKLLEYYDSVEIQVKAARVESDGKRANVDATILRKDGKPPIPLTFSMKQSGGEWKVWDIKAENISLVLNFRTQIDAEIRKSDIASVIQRLNAGQIDVTPDSSKPAGKS